MKKKFYKMNFYKIGIKKFYKNLIHHKFKLLFLFFNFTIFICIFPLMTYSQTCINYLGGIGELEAAYPTFNSFYGNKVDDKVKSIGLYFGNLNFYGLKTEINLDFKEKISGEASQRIQIYKKPEININNNPYVEFIIPAKDSESINPENKNFYPKPEDEIEAYLYLKSSSLENLRYKITIVGHYFNPYNNQNNFRAIFDQPFQSLATGWIENRISISIPNFSNFPNLKHLYLKLEFNFPNPSLHSKGTFWLDNVRFYIKRNNSCIIWPNKITSSLKFFEVFRNFYLMDFIDIYKRTHLQFSIYPQNLIVKSYDPSYKIALYTHPIVMLKNYSLEKEGWAEESSIINEFVDDLSFITSDQCSLAEFLFHPNANYPDLLKIDGSTQIYPYKYKSSCIDRAYQGIKTLYNHPFLLDVYSKTLTKIKTFFPNRNLGPDFIYLDAIALGSDDLSFQTSNVFQIKRGYFEFISFLNKKISPLFKIVGNLGYLPYSDSNNILDLINFYNVRKFLDGYLDEGWLLTPHRVPLEHYPSRTHKIFKTVIENQSFKYILIVGAALGDNCQTDPKLKDYMISSFYLINNQNTYFALTPLTSFRVVRYNPPQCYENSMYLPLGNPKPISTIDDLVVTSTLNYAKGALYKREYDNGLILLNSSNDLTFNYLLSTSTFPNFSSLIDQYGNIYNLPTTIQIPSTTGLILYRPSTQE